MKSWLKRFLALLLVPVLALGMNGCAENGELEELDEDAAIEGEPFEDDD